MRHVAFRGLFCLAFLLLALSISGLIRAEEARENVPGWRAQADTLISHAKMVDARDALAALERGNGQGRFIVLLQPPKSASVSGELASDAAKATRRQLVEATREAALRAMPDFPRTAIVHAFDNLFGFSAIVSTDQLAMLLANPDVVAVEPVRELHAHLKQGIPLQHAERFRSVYNGQGLSVAIVDTGIDYENPFLNGGTGGFPNSKVIGGYDFGEEKADPMDRNGHGTACAGIVAGELCADCEDYIGGIAYKARLYALKISSTSTGGSATTDAMVASWDWAVSHQNADPDHPIMVVSTSFGGGMHTGVCDQASPAMTQAAKNAQDAGITIFASSGNDGYCDAMGWPACISSVVSVGAVYDADIGRSGWLVEPESCAEKVLIDDKWVAIDDPTAADMVTAYSNSADFLDIFAPSNDASTLQASFQGSTFYSDFGGTSAACPYTAGAAAALQSGAKKLNGDWLGAEDVVDWLKNTGDARTDRKTEEKEDFDVITKPRVNLETAMQRLDQQQGNLRVDIDPTQASGRWRRISAKAWQDGGTEETDVDVGVHTVEFESLDDWDKPANIAVEVSSGETGVGTGTYVAALGDLRMTLEPEEVAAQVRWRRAETGDWQDSGIVEEDVPSGEHEIHFSDIDDWNTPDPVSVTVMTGQETGQTARYTQGTGSVSVLIEPEEALAQGQWRMVGTETWKDGGDIAEGVPAGRRGVEFSDIEGFFTPEDLRVTVTQDQTLLVAGTYVPKTGPDGKDLSPGGLQVFIHPADARDAGASWRNDGSDAWRVSGYTESVNPGYRAVEFLPVPGWETPDRLIVPVDESDHVQVQSAYVQTGQNPGQLQVFLETNAARTAGAQWRRVGSQKWRDSGEIESNVPAGQRTVEFRELPGWIAPFEVAVLIKTDEKAHVAVRYEEEAPAVQAIPTLSEWGMILLSALIVLFGARALREKIRGPLHAA